jgi:hypothetical protein
VLKNKKLIKNINYFCAPEFTLGAFTRNNMAVAPRPNSKATRIAFNILGVPSNMKGMYKESTKKGKEERIKINTNFTDSMFGTGS